MPTAKPTARQLEFQDWEFGLFIHFGIRTFYEGHRDMDGKSMDPAQFLPEQLDCDQWIATAKAAGMRYAVMTAKHHDGFANWPSAYTDFSVAASPWKDGRGDVVQEFCDACRRHDMACGLYYSPYDASCPVYDDESAYDDYFINQIAEILTGRGRIDMIWFDGCGSSGHTYDWSVIVPRIREMQPDILIFSMGDPDYRWVGNEDGIAPRPVWNTVESTPVAVDTDTADSFDGALKWLPAECDCRMRECNWFYSDEDEHTVKTIDELTALYEYSVGRGCNMLLNIGPDRRGLLPDVDAARLVEFGAEIRRRYGAPVATTEHVTRTDDGWFCKLPEPNRIDHVVLMEDLADGEHVRRFRIRANPDERMPVTVWEGYNIGHKAICRFPPYPARSIAVDLLECEGEAALRSLTVHAAYQR